MAVDKNKALETALGQIEKQFGKGAVMRLGQNQHMNIEHISTGSLSLDIALGIGGLPGQKVAQAHFAAGADQQIHVRLAAGIQLPRKGFLVDRLGGRGRRNYAAEILDGHCMRAAD